MRYDARSAECVVFVEREGVLRRVGHDVKLTVKSFTIDVDNGTVEASFDAPSIEVTAAMVGTREDPTAFSDRDKATILEHIRRDVLDVGRHPTITFVAHALTRDESSLHGEGTLALCGVERTLVVRAQKRGDVWIAEQAIHQPDFGIKPFSAMLGALKVKPTITVRLTIPAT